MQAGLPDGHESERVNLPQPRVELECGASELASILQSEWMTRASS